MLSNHQAQEAHQAKQSEITVHRTRPKGQSIVFDLKARERRLMRTLLNGADDGGDEGDGDDKDDEDDEGDEDDEDDDDDDGDDECDEDDAGDVGDDDEMMETMKIPS